MSRKLYAGSDVHRALSIAELRAMARRRLPQFAFEYIDGGAEDELTLRRNRGVFDAIRFVPDTLVDTSARSLRTPLFGRESAAPLIIAPTGLNGIAHHRGDVALARAAAATGVPFTLSTVSNVRLEEVAKEAGGRLWMQLYLFQDRAITDDIVARADRAGYEALVLTTDANLFGRREWDRRNYRAPGRLSLRNLFDVALHPRWLLEVIVAGGVPRFENVIDFLPPQARTAAAGVTVFPGLFSQDISWDDVIRLRQAWPRKLIVKGLLSANDALRAAELGCDGIVVSNHGGRADETLRATIDSLPEVVAAVGGRVPVFVDSGFRRGTDVFKALALGATAVGVGRPYIWGLGAFGQQGVEKVIDILTRELRIVMMQMGTPSLAKISRSSLELA